MADRFMQQDARPAGAEHHRQHPRRGGDCRKVHQRHAHGFFRPGISPHVALLGGEEIVIAKASTAAAAAALTLAILFHQHADRKAHQRANVRGEGAVGGGHQNQLINTGQAGGYFLDAFVGGTGHAINATQNIQFLFAAHAL